MLLTKDQILEAQDLPFEDVEVKEWGGIVRVYTMTAGERDSYESTIYDTDGETVKVNRDDFRAKMLAHCLKDEKGVRLFTGAEIKKLSGKSAKPVQRLFEVAQNLNGISKGAQEDIKKK